MLESAAAAFDCQSLSVKYGAVHAVKALDLKIENGERVAQLVIAKHEQADWELVEELESSERGAGGFGHTGKS